MPKLKCPKCKKSWPENYCYECGGPIDAALFKKTDGKKPLTPLGRKVANEKALRRLRIPINPGLPKSSGAEAVKPASAQEVAWRACVVSALVGRACGAPAELVQAHFEQQGLFKHASRKEQAAVRRAKWTDRVAEEYRCQVEGLWELAWALGLIPKVDHFEECANTLVRLLPRANEAVLPFVEKARLRPLDELLDEEDLLFRMHWAVRNGRVNIVFAGAGIPGLPVPPGMFSGQPGSGLTPNGLPEYVTEERLRAIRWVLFPETSWEDTDTST